MYVCVDEVPEDLPDAQWSVNRTRDSSWVDVYEPDTSEEHAICSFDGQGRRGTGAVAGFLEGDEDDLSIAVDKASGRPEIWFSVNTDARLVRVDITYPEYLDTMLLTRGLIRRPYLYADPDDPGFRDTEPDPRPQVDFLARTFPRDDFSDLRARAEALARAHR